MSWEIFPHRESIYVKVGVSNRLLLLFEFFLLRCRVKNLNKTSLRNERERKNLELKMHFPYRIELPFYSALNQFYNFFRFHAFDLLCAGW